jgi:hypothetical protein
MMSKEEKIKTGIYLLVFTRPVTHTYSFSIDTKGTHGNGGIQDYTSNLRSNCPDLPYYTKEKNSRPDTTTLHHLESSESGRKEQATPVSPRPR